jgi:predicted adenine nucleotide alpha hydrolase (AANH) superfamily ATPase
MQEMFRMNDGAKRTLLLHACCAPCMTHPVQVLKGKFFVTIFFFNPNIHPRIECLNREREAKRLAQKWRIPCIVGEYDSSAWYEAVGGYEDEPEGGRRCEICYRIRLERTAQEAKRLGIDCFCTTLSVSPHKKAAVINRIGKELEEEYGVGFYEADFKKKDGFKESCRLSEAEGLYRQNYCGCKFSMRK